MPIRRPLGELDLDDQTSVLGQPTTTTCLDLLDGEISSILASPFDVLPSLDQLIRSRQYVRQNGQAGLVGGLHVDN
jgi:hypothetical protein